MDAASKTGVDDVRDLIEFSRYGPTSAKYKIFIIDEVHMLSKQAFLQYLLLHKFYYIFLLNFQDTVRLQQNIRFL